MKGYNHDNKDVATVYKNHITDNRYTPFAKLNSVNKYVTESYLTEDSFVSLIEQSDVNRNVSHYKTPSKKKIQKNNTRVSKCIVDVNQSRLQRKLSLSINSNHTNNKIQQNSVVFNSSTRDNNLTQ